VTVNCHNANAFYNDYPSAQARIIGSAVISAPLCKRDQDEIRCSAEIARQAVLRPADVQRYLRPPSDTPYPREYAFHLLGDMRERLVLDLGCGTGQNLIPLARRGARTIGMDISPELVALARQRVQDAGVKADLRVASAYETGLPDRSIDVIFCMALIHHLDIATLRTEMHRILAKDGFIIVSEPIRFSAGYNRARALLPSHETVSDHEHPLTRDEFAALIETFQVESARYFRLPLLPLAGLVLPVRVADGPRIWRIDRWILQKCRPARKYATVVTMRLRRVEA
jgi:SAM-dependent methyltransferase